MYRMTYSPDLPLTTVADISRDQETFLIDALAQEIVNEIDREILTEFLHLDYSLPNRSTYWPYRSMWQRAVDHQTNVQWSSEGF